MLTKQYRGRESERQANLAYASRAVQGEAALKATYPRAEL